MSNCLKQKLVKVRMEVGRSETHPLLPVVNGEGLHGALEFESKLADKPGTLFGLDPGLGRL